MISSTSNTRVKQVIALQQKSKERKVTGCFVIEGIRLFREVPEQLFREIYVAEDYVDKEEICQLLSGKEYEIVTQEVFQKMSDTQTPQGILAVVEMPRYELEDMLGESPLLVLLEDIQDPGNLGTIMRTAEGAGVDGIIMSSNTVDLFNPKTVRSTMGSIFRVPFLYVDDLEKVITRLHREQIMTYAAHLEGDRLYDEISYLSGTAFLIGNEGKGLKKQTADLANSYMKIPMKGRLESLNAAVATALLVYEAARQRRKI